MSRQSSAARARSKRKVLDSWLGTIDIIGIQETHGIYEDIVELRHFNPSYVIEASLTGNSAGILLAIHKRIIGTGSVSFDILFPGRCIAVEIQMGGSSLLAINLHVDQRWTPEQKLNVYRSIRDKLGPLTSDRGLVRRFQFSRN